MFIDKPIRARDSESRAEYVDRALAWLYSSLEQYILEHPDSWEAWLYIYKFAAKKPIEILPKPLCESMLTRLENARFNHAKYAIYHNQNDSLIINRSSLQAYELAHLRIAELDNPAYLQTLATQDLVQLLSKQIVA